jgi:hypothetical protein
MATSIQPFGRGLLCPFQRDGKGDFANGAGRHLLASDIGELLGVIGPMGVEGGELPWNMDLGSRLNAIRHRNAHSDLVRATADAMTAGIIQRYEKRVRCGQSQIQPSADGRTLDIRFSYIPLGDTQGAVFYDHTVKE